MVMPFSPAFVAIGIAALLAGAAAGAWIAHQVPHYRRMISVALFAMIALAVLTGFRADSFVGEAMMADGAGMANALFGAWTRQIAVIAFLCGAQTMIVQEDTHKRLIGLAIAGIIGAPVLTNISFGIGMSAMTAMV
jgi:hypothetical protein